LSLSERMAKYEILLLLRPKVGSDITTPIQNELNLLQNYKNFKITYYGLVPHENSKSFDFLPVPAPVETKLAYEIKKEKKGIYVMLSFEANETANINEFVRISYLNPVIMRHMIINLDNEYGARAAKNPKKVKSSKLTAARYAKNRDEIFKNKNTSSLAGAGVISTEKNEELEDFDSSSVPFEDGLTSDEPVVIKKKVRKSAKTEESKE